MNTQTEQPLTASDKAELRKIAKAHLLAWLLIVAFMVTLALVLAAGLLLVSYWKGTPSPGIERRVLWGAALPFLLVLFFLWRNLQPYLDLRKGKKYVYVLQEYNVEDLDNQWVLTINEKGFKNIPLEDCFRLRIKREQALHIEVTPKSRQLLFLSQDGRNWLEE